MKYLNVFATPEEIQSIKDAVNMPCIMIGTCTPRSPLEISHSFALRHGLPEISGYYGCDLRTGEFVSV